MRMVIGPDKFYKCPACGNTLKNRSILSGNTCGATFYSDGRRVAPMLPDIPNLTKCPSCNTILWLSDLQELEQKEVPYAEHLELTDLWRALETNDAVDKREKRLQEIFIRHRIWWEYNKNNQLKKSEEATWHENCLALLELLDVDNNDHRCMAAELHRNLENFSQCLDLVKTLPEEYDKFRSMTEEAYRLKNPQTFQLDENRQEHYRQIQSEQSIEEQMVTFLEDIQELKEIVSKRDPDKDFSDFICEDIQDFAKYIAVMAFFEEYELLEVVLNTKQDALNTHVHPQFVYWQPTPLYFITGKKAREKMKDPCKMVRFLAAHGADVNKAAGDGSTPLWNQTNYSDSIEMLKTLLELGANPNQTSIDEGIAWTPLINCLRPMKDEDDIGLNYEGWIPFDTLAIQKAKLLLEYGADANLASPTQPDYPPLMMAISYGFTKKSNLDVTDDVTKKLMLELLELMLKRSANPNFEDSNRTSPLSLARKGDLPEVVDLLQRYGAKLEVIRRKTGGKQ